MVIFMAEAVPYTFANEKGNAPVSGPESWKVFIVDDDKDIHHITKMALKDLKFKDRPITFESAYSAEEAIKLLKSQSDFAIILLDIGMETPDAGLEVANFIRKQLNDDIVRIIIRTGQPGEVPEREIIDSYDINDYKSKTELTLEKLFTSIRTALAQYDQINELANINEELEERIEQAIAKQKQQQEKLFAQNRNTQMNELLNMIAHQWRQPLARISAVTAQLKMALALDEIDPGTFNTQIDHIEHYTSDLSNTINEFKTMYEPSQRAQPIALYDLLKRSASIISNSFQEQNISTTVTGDEKALISQVTGELYQVILNILKNAQEAFLKRSISPAHITITATQADDKIIIKITDNAGGIEKEAFEHIFDPYFSTKSDKNGKGLGLHISKNIIEQKFNGDISAENIDDGAAFTIVITKS